MRRTTLHAAAQVFTRVERIRVKQSRLIALSIVFIATTTPIVVGYIASIRSTTLLEPVTSELDAGSMDAGGTKYLAFVLDNPGARAVTIGRFECSCGCLALASSEIPPT